MKIQKFFSLCWSVVFLIGFALWTALVCLVDVRAVGPNGSAVGLATINIAFQNMIGVNMALYSLTDWLSVIPLLFVCGFGLLGITQWILRKSIWKVDRSVIALGVHYLLVFLAYCLFEMFPVNYRPILIAGRLEASYPSSTTLLALCVMITAVLQLRTRIQNGAVKRGVTLLLGMFTLFMVVGRILSGVHWFSDIVGGLLLSSSLIMLYVWLADCK